MTYNDKTGERLATLEAHYADIKDDLSTIIAQNNEIIPKLSANSNQIDVHEKRLDSISNRAWGALISGFLALFSFCGMLIKNHMAGGPNP